MGKSLRDQDAGIALPTCTIWSADRPLVCGISFCAKVCNPVSRSPSCRTAEIPNGFAQLGFGDRSEYVLDWFHIAMRYRTELPDDLLREGLQPSQLSWKPDGEVVPQPLSHQRPAPTLLHFNRSRRWPSQRCHFGPDIIAHQATLIEWYARNDSHIYYPRKAEPRTSAPSGCVRHDRTGRRSPHEK